MSLTGRHILFRADASVRIGSGHVMRCLTLADRLAAAGATCRFVMRRHEGHLGDMVQSRGHAAALLPPGDGHSGLGNAHAQWLGTDWRTDAAQTLAAAAGWQTDLVVVDHYALDHGWQSALRTIAPRLMVIDDLADRRHLADILLDQNLGSQATDYAELLPANALSLIGPQYALLRPEFGALHEELRRARTGRPLRHILVAVSGTDPDNISEWVLDQLDRAKLPPNMSIKVVLGNSAPHHHAVAAQAARMHPATKLLVGVSDMSPLFAEADLCIGAAGGMSWERCCLGLPTLLLVLADNQVKAAQALTQAGAGLLVGDVRHPALAERFHGQLSQALDLHHREAMSQRALAICDGCGTQRIIEALNDIWTE